VTVIIAIEHPDTGERAIAADGRHTCGDSIISEKVEKLATNGRVVVGFSGSVQLLVAVREILRSPEGAKFTSVTEVAAAARQHVDTAGWKRNEFDGKPPEWHFWGVGIDSVGIWNIDSAFTATSVEPGRPATAGSGGPEAMGAVMVMIEAEDWRPEEVVRRAVAAAAKCTTGCGGQTVSVVIPAAHGRKLRGAA
jgi:ATP-dependent protease HslVU (ClpYQ) peptidase subunit